MSRKNLFTGFLFAICMFFFNSGCGDSTASTSKATDMEEEDSFVYQEIDEEVEVATTCEKDEDCSENVCSGLICAEGNCVQVTADSKPCDDGNAETINDTCSSGICVGEKQTDDCGRNADCDDQDKCTTDTCDIDGACLHAKIDNCCKTNADCNDEDDCSDDYCMIDGKCQHDSITGCTAKCKTNNDCDDDDDCTNDVCGIDGVCKNLQKETCGEDCATNADCDDGDNCTSDLCLADKTCLHKPNTDCECVDDTGCDDADECTTDVCTADNKCEHFPVENCNVSCQTADDCDDSDLCTTDVCDSGNQCQHIALSNCGGTCQTAEDCDDNDLCTTDVCDSDNICQHIALNNCGGSCQTAGDCDDGDECTTDICDADNKCQHIAVENCGGGCQTADDCDDADPCTTDICDIDKNCHYVTFKNCTGTCQLSADCDDGDACTTDICATGNECLYIAISNCGGSCQTSDDCVDLDPCTSDICDSQKFCHHVSLGNCGGDCENDTECDDDNYCTVDACVDGVCESDAGAMNGQWCSDQNTETVKDVCLNGLCAGSTVECQFNSSCADGNDCNIESCVENMCVSEIKNNGDLCNDGNIETVNDVCHEGVCLGTVAGCFDISDCNDGNICTTDTCDLGLTVPHCFYEFNDGAVCNDNDPFSKNDVCGDGVCKGAYACVENVECDDSNDCTDDTCVNFSCLSVINAAVYCDDHNDATVNDACDAGICKGELPECNEDAECDDGNPCTLNICDEFYHCNPTGYPGQYSVIGAPCDDNNPNTMNDVCQVQYDCQGVPPVPCLINADCALHQVCIDGNCGFEIKTCESDYDCSDGVVCTYDACYNGVCWWANNLPSSSCCMKNSDCDDDNPQTTDTCDKAGKCSNIFEVQVGQISIDMKTTNVKADSDSYILAGTETQANRYLGELVFTTADEAIKMKTLTLQNLGSGTNKSVKEMKLIKDDGTVVATTLVSANGDAVFNPFDMVFPADQTTSLFISLVSKGMNVNGDATSTAVYGEDYEYVIGDATIEGADSGNELVIGKNSLGNNDGLPEIGEIDDVDVSTNAMVVGSRLNSITNVMPDGVMTGGFGKVIGQYKLSFDNGANRLADNSAMMAKIDDLNLTVFKSPTVNIDYARVYIQGSFDMVVATVNGGCDTVSTSCYLEWSGAALQDIQDGLKNTALVDGEITLYFTATLAVSSDEYLQTSLADLSAGDFSYIGNADSTMVLTDPRLEYNEVIGGTLTK
jgi:hypothetical protein